MRLGEVPLWAEGFWIQIYFHNIQTIVSVGETEVIVVQSISGYLASDVLNLMPEVRND